jgi:hypothetical protein
MDRKETFRKALLKLLSEQRFLTKPEIHELGEEYGLNGNTVAGQIAKMVKEGSIAKADGYTLPVEPSASPKDEKKPPAIYR